MFVNSLPNDVTWFSSAQVGAPSMAGTSSSDMLKVLDACLVDGFGSKTVLTITVDGDNVTLGFGIGHGYLERQRVLVSGANDPLLNGNHRIVSMTNNTVTLNIAGVSDTTGTITTKVAPLGFESIFGDTDELRRAYRSTSAASSKRVLFLDMTYPADAGYNASTPAKRATVSICENMETLGTQINSITDPVNNFASQPNGSLFWYQRRAQEKVTAITNATLTWKVIGNGDFFYLLIDWMSGVAALSGKKSCDVFGFGDFAKIGESAQESTFLIAVRNSNDASRIETPRFIATYTQYTNENPSVYCMTDSGFASTELNTLLFTSTGYSLVSGQGLIAYPNGTASALFTHPLRLCKGGSNILGVMPSIMFVENNVASGGNTHDGSVVDDVLLTHVHGTSQTSSFTSGYYGFYLGD